VFPHFYGINNPVDLTAQVKDEDYATVLEELKDDYDGFLVIALPNVLGITEGLAERLKAPYFRQKNARLSYHGCKYNREIDEAY